MHPLRQAMGRSHKLSMARTQVPAQLFSDHVYIITLEQKLISKN